MNFNPFFGLLGNSVFNERFPFSTTFASNYSSKSILEFPTEILLKIFQYVPNKITLKLVCKDFHKICLMEGCRLVIDEVSIFIVSLSRFNMLDIIENCRKVSNST